MSLGKPELFIDGVWQLPALGGTLPVVCPASEEVVGHVGAATAADVDLAVAAATRAFKSWRRTSGAERAALLRKVAAGVRARKAELAVLEATDNGKPLDEAEWDMDDVAVCFDFFADKAEALDGGGDTAEVALPDDRFACAVKKEPLGVCALVTPWNYPLLMATWKVAPCLAAGCCALLKPSEMASLTCQVLAECIAAAGVPPGVFALLTGLGTDAGAPLVAHKGVDKVAFTGSLATGRRIMAACCEDVKPLTLELGGKSAVLVFDEPSHGSEQALDRLVEWIMFGCFWTNGQICSATSRLLVQASIAPRLLARLKLHSEAIAVGDPMKRNPPTRLGPLVSALQYSKVTAMVAQAQAEGAQLLTGGGRPDGCPVGYFLQPTVLTGVTPAMTIFKEEVFGPVLAVTTFETEEEALALANNSDYALGAAVLSDDVQLRARLTAGLECGLLWLGCSQPCFCHSPWGGKKRSGFGRELGPDGLANYQNTKAITT